MAFFVISPPGVYHNTEVVAFANSRYVNKLKAEGSSPTKNRSVAWFFNGKYCAKEVKVGKGRKLQQEWVNLRIIDIHSHPF